MGVSMYMPEVGYGGRSSIALHLTLPILLLDLFILSL